MKKLAVLGSFLLLIGHFATDAATYYTRSAGNWTGNIWGTTTTGAGGALPALNDGDVIYIDDDITINTNISTDADITVIIDAALTISGQLRVGQGSIFQFPSSAGKIIAAGGGNSAKIVIGNGGSSWSGNDDDLTGPGSFDDNWTCCTLVLPVKLIDFTIDVDQQTVSLKWATIMEENFREFIVERADDGLNYRAIGSIAGKGFDIHDIESRYSFIDEHPLMGLNYYRLKAIDLDESYEYFGVKAARVESPRQVAVHPNPSSGDAISFNLNFHPGESARIVVLDQRGIEVFSAGIGTLQTTLAFENKLRPGIYLLRYISGDFENTSRFIVKN